MERSEWQVAASAARFDGGRDLRRERAQATVADLSRRPELRAAPSMGTGAQRGDSRSLRPREAPVEAPPGFELDWAGNVVRRPVRRGAAAGATTTTVRCWPNSLAPAARPFPKQSATCATKTTKAPMLATASPPSQRPARIVIARVGQPPHPRRREPTPHPLAPPPRYHSRRASGPTWSPPLPMPLLADATSSATSTSRAPNPRLPPTAPRLAPPASVSRPRSSSPRARTTPPRIGRALTPP